MLSAAQGPVSFDGLFETTPHAHRVGATSTAEAGSAAPNKNDAAPEAAPTEKNGPTSNGGAPALPSSVPPRDRRCTVCASGLYLPHTFSSGDDSEVTRSSRGGGSRGSRGVGHGQQRQQKRQGGARTHHAAPSSPPSRKQGDNKQQSKATSGGTGFGRWDTTATLDRFDKELRAWRRRQQRRNGKNGEGENDSCNDNDDAPNPVVAPLRSDEIRLGKVLGKGGTATVYEVAALRLLAAGPGGEGGEEGAAARRALLSRSEGGGGDGSISSKGGDKELKERYVVKKLSAKLLCGRVPEGSAAAAVESTSANEDHELASRIFATARTNLILEIRILKHLGRHPNIVTLYGASVDDDENDDEDSGGPFLLLSRCTEGMERRILKWRARVRKYQAQLEHPSLWRIFSAAVEGSRSGASARGDMPPAQRKLRGLLWERMRAVRDVGLAVDHMHGRGIVYRDLKVTNVGFDAAGVVKIFDFGLSRFLPREEKAEEERRRRERNGEGQRPVHLLSGDDYDRPEEEEDEVFAMSRVGTPIYMAPEVMARRPYNFKADVYSLGVLLWQVLALLTPKPLLPAKTDEKTGERIFPLYDFKTCPCWPGVTRELLSSLLSVDPADRPSMREAHERLSAQLRTLERAFAPPSTTTAASKQRIQRRRQESSQSLRSNFQR